MEHGRFDVKFANSTRSVLFRHGTSDEAVLHQVFTHKNYDLARLRRGPELIDLYHRIVASSKSPLIVDGGAYIGASPIFFEHLFPSAHVVAVEPERDNFDLLRFNLGGSGVELIHGALTGRSGRARVEDPGEGCWGYRTKRVEDENQTENSVPCVTVNEIYGRLSGDCVPFVVKIDIEGGEYDLFSTATEWVAETPLIIVELHDWLLVGEANSRPFLRCVSQDDRDFVYIGENVFSISNTLVSPR
jgi:FkbM family methyltransferase